MKKYLIILYFVLIVTSNCEKITYVDDNVLPQFSVDPASTVSDTAIYIQWETDEACRGVVYYHIDGHPVVDSAVAAEYRQKHILTLPAYDAGLSYKYQVKIWDYYDNGPVSSDSLSFASIPNDLSRGWASYSEKNYTQAESYINDWLEQFPLAPNGLAARGWILLQLGNYEEALNDFTRALEIEPNSKISLAGLCLANNLLDVPEEVIRYSTRLFNLDPEWIFIYNFSINHRKLRLLTADAYIKTAEPGKALEQVNIIWPENGLDPNVPSTWHIGQSIYDTFEAALIGALDYIATNIEL